MADYISILDKAVSGLADNTPDTRSQIYAKARAAIERKLRAMDPLPPEPAIAKQLGQLEDAIGEVENRYNVSNSDIEAAFNKAFSLPNEDMPAEPAAADVGAQIPAQSVDEPEVEEQAIVVVPNGFIDEPILIDGIGEKIAKLLAEQGISTISQIAAMTDSQLAFVTKTIGYPGFELTQEWRQQSLDMLSGKLPRGKTNQDRLAKIQEAAADAAAPKASPVDVGLPPMAEDVSRKDKPGSFQDVETSLPVENEFTLNNEPPIENPVETIKSGSEEKQIQTPVETRAAPVAAATSSFPQTGTNATGTFKDAVRDGSDSKDWFSTENSELPKAEKPAADSSTNFEDLIRNIENLNKAPAEAKPATSEVYSKPRQPDEAPAQPAVPPMRRPELVGDAPPYVTELDNDPMKQSSDDVYLGERNVRVPSRKAGGGKVFGGLLAILLLGGAAGAGYYYRDIVMKTANEGLTAVRELISTSGGSATGDAEKPANDTTSKAAQPGSNEADSDKDNARLGTGENGVTEPVEPAPKPVRTITVPVEQPAEKLPEPETPPASVEVQEEKPAEPAVTETPAVETPAVETPAAESVTPAQPETSVEPAAINGEKTYLYEEASGANGASRDEGSIAWSLVNEAPEAGSPPEPVIKGVMEIPSRGLVLNMTIKRNLDAGLPASHIIELIFTAPPEFSGGNIDGVSRFVLKATEQARGESLVGVPARIDTGYFLIALNNLDQAQQTNLNLLENSDWIDIPVSYVTGRRALLTFEKGASGNAVFKQALADWKNR